jgi:hypothetical protein
VIVEGDAGTDTAIINAVVRGRDGCGLLGVVRGEEQVTRRHVG